jgi:hypothetical protein
MVDDVVGTIASEFADVTDDRQVVDGGVAVTLIAAID